MHDHTYCTSTEEPSKLLESFGEQSSQQSTESALELEPLSPAGSSSHSSPPPSSQSSSSSSSSSSPSPSSGQDQSDSSYTVSSGSSFDSDDEEDEHHKYLLDKKYIVFDSELERLLYGQICNECVGGHITELRKNIVGTLLSVAPVCVCGNVLPRWESQPRIGQMPVGNLLCTSSAIFSGETHGSIDFFMSLLNLENIGKTKFSDNQKHLVFAAINDAYVKNIHDARRAVDSVGITVSCDGRCDSPGYNAKYCSYTLMHLPTHKILAMALV